VTISDIILLLLPFLTALAVWCLRHFEKYLPAKQVQVLNQFAKYAVQKVEQSFTGTSTQKKEQAIRIVANLFTAAKLPIPAMELIDAALESFVYELNQFQDPTDPPELTTGPLPVPPTKPQPIAPAPIA
jgi:LL-H family phage holin